MSRKRRQLVIIGAETGKGESAPLGRLKDVRTTLAGFNTSPDGGQAPGGPLERLYGPGMTIELPTSADTVAQAMAHLTDEDLAFPVLERLCRATTWRLMDVESGRVMAF